MDGSPATEDCQHSIWPMGYGPAVTPPPHPMIRAMTGGIAGRVLLKCMTALHSGHEQVGTLLITYCPPPFHFHLPSPSYSALLMKIHLFNNSNSNNRTFI